MDFKGQRRVVCPDPIPPLAQGALALIASDARLAFRDAHTESMIARDAEIDQWIEKDIDAQAFLIQYIGTQQQTHVRNCDTAFEMWEKLKSYYQLKGEVEIANANALLSAIVMSESEELSPYVQRLQDLHDLLERLGEPVTESKKASNLLNSLNSKYFPMIDIIQTWAVTAPNLYNVQTILSTLLQRDVRATINARKRGDSTQTVPQANYGGAGAPRNNPGSSGRGMGACHNCQKTGHVVRDCPQPVLCSHCRQPGHLQKACWKFHGRPDGRGKTNEGGKNKAVMCGYCGKGPHKEADCYKKIADSQRKANVAISHDSEFDASRALSYTASSHCFSASSNVKSPLILDSGATDHIFPSIEYFTGYSTEVPLELRFIYTADEKPHEVKGRGWVTLQLHNGVEENTVRLKALHVPSLGQTLVSLSRINKRGQVAFTLSKNGTPTLTQHDRPWADVTTTRNGILLLSGHIVMPGMEGGDIAAHGQALSVDANWHLRLGHPGLSVMEAMAARDMIPSLTKSEKSTVVNCEICCAGKMAQRSHKPNNEESTDCAPLDRVHLDLVGPMAPSSKHGGYTYFQSGIDVGSRLSFVSLLRTKGEAFAAYKPLITALEVEARTNLKTLRTDGGGEYISGEWKAFAQEKGFQHQLTAPDSPEQNGVNERLNRTLLEKMRCLLICSELPKSYWDVALLHANWLRNRSPTSALKGGVPHTVWTGKEQNLKHVHTFGCLVQYLKVGHDKDKMGKLAPKTAYGIFLGMPKAQSGYLIWDPTRPEILVRSDVKFHEDTPGYPRLLQKATPLVPRDSDFFNLFPMGEGQPKAPSAVPIRAVVPTPPSPTPPSSSPIDAIQLSSDTESGVHDTSGHEEAAVDTPQREESIADRVALRRRAQFASFGDVL